MNIQFSDYVKKINKDFLERTLIDIACIKSGMLSRNHIKEKLDFLNFKKLSNGIPILIPFIPEIIESNDYFHIEYPEYSKMIFGENSQDYIGAKLSFKTNKFVSDFKIKSKFKNILNEYVKEILDTKLQISLLKDKYNHIGAFQTRNIPHFGHEKIIEMMLNYCDLVVINPIIGPKKLGDVKTEKLKIIYESILKPRFNNRICYIPIRANMFYAGPREAIHHSFIREWLGFSHFSVGRDHAGSDGFYSPEAAKQILKRFQSNFNIKILHHNGAYFCEKCKKTVLKGTCNHNVRLLQEISGSELRSCLKNKKTYKYASKNIQNWAAKNFLKLF